MENTFYIVALISVFVIGIIGGGMIVFFFRRMVINRQLRAAQRKAARTVSDARVEAKDILQEAKLEGDKTKSTAEGEYRERRSELQRQETRLSSKQETLDRRIEGLEQRDRNLSNKEKSIESVRTELTEVRDKQTKQLELISNMSSNEGRKAERGI
jgi:ribonuclease Y